MFDLFAADLMGAIRPLASSRHSCFAFVPEGLQLDRSFTAKNPG
jgi:hypothetical protein